MDDRLLHHCIHTDADVAGPAPGEPCVGRRDPWAKPAVIVEPLPLPIPSRREDHGRGSHILGPIRNHRNRRVTVVLQPPRVTDGAAAGRHQAVTDFRYSGSRSSRICSGSTKNWPGHPQSASPSFTAR